MEEKREKRIRMLTLAFGIALMPPIWAVLSPYMGISTGAVALICAGLYVANGNQRKDALKITVGFLCGDVWAVLAVWIMEAMPFHPNVELYCTLFVLIHLRAVLAVRLGHRTDHLRADEGAGVRDASHPDWRGHDRRGRVCGDRGGCIPEDAAEKIRSIIRNKKVRLLVQP